MQGTEGGPPAVAPRHSPPDRKDSAVKKSSKPGTASQPASTNAGNRGGNRAGAANAKAATPASAQASASSPEITAAQSSGKVWVNLDSGIYHKSGRWYGKTKSGKFMTEAEAKAAGYKEASKD